MELLSVANAAKSTVEVLATADFSRYSEVESNIPALPVILQRSESTKEVATWTTTMEFLNQEK